MRMGSVCFHSEYTQIIYSITVLVLCMQANNVSLFKVWCSCVNHHIFVRSQDTDSLMEWWYTVERESQTYFNLQIQMTSTDGNHCLLPDFIFRMG